MSKCKAKRIAAAAMAAVLTISLASCSSVSGNTESTGSTAQQEITISYTTYRVGTHVSAKAETKLIDDFNTKYAGKYKVVVEEVPSDQAYADKMKVLAASQELPDVVEGKDGIRELAISNGQAIDLTSFVNEDADYKKSIGDEAIKANTVDGKLYSIANGNQIIGYFYNKELFEKAGITPATTWSGFMDNLKKLKDAGITPISMMTGENCWTTNLLLAAMVGTSDDTGNTFMKTQYPTTYKTKEVTDALTMIQTILSQYTTKDALGADYNVAANHFLNGETAIICNGPWMESDFSNTEKAMEGLADKVDVAVYPNDGAFAQYEVGYMDCASTPEKQKAAFEFIKYKTGLEGQQVMLEMSGTVPLTNEVQISDEYKANNPLMSKIIEMGNAAKYKFNTFDNMAYSGVITEMGKAYPSLANGEITPEQFAGMMDDAAAKSK